MSTSQGVAGVWDIMLSRPGNTYSGVFTFTPTGAARTADGAVGTWWSHTGDGRFSYRMEDDLKGPDGNPAGRLQMNQDATLDGDTFEGSGIHYVFSPAGERVAEVEVQITGKRR